MSDCRNPCQEIICTLPSDYEYDLQSLPPAPQVFLNNQVTRTVACADGTSLQYSGTLPSWIRLVSASDQLIGNAGVYAGTTQAEANAAAQLALDNFVSAALSSGSLACETDCVTPTTFPDFPVGTNISNSLLAHEPVNNRLWFHDNNPNLTVYVFNLADDSPAFAITLGAGQVPRGITYDSVNGKMVICCLNNDLVFINATTGAIGTTLPSGINSQANRRPMGYDSTRGYLLCMDITTGGTGDVRLVNCATETIINSVNLGYAPAAAFYCPTTDRYYFSPNLTPTMKSMHPITLATVDTTIVFAGGDEYMEYGKWYPGLSVAYAETNAFVSSSTGIRKLDIVGGSILASTSSSYDYYYDFDVNCDGWLYASHFGYEVRQFALTDLTDKGCATAVTNCYGVFFDTLTGRVRIGYDLGVTSIGTC